MDKFRTGAAAAAAVISLTTGYFVYNKALSSGALTNADTVLQAEITTINGDIKKLEERRSNYNKSIEKNNEVKFQNEEQNKKITKLNEQIDEYKKKTDELEKQLKTAKAKQDRLAQHESGIKSISAHTMGEKIALGSGIYKCTAQATEITAIAPSPSATGTAAGEGQIPPGRYKLSGTGSFRIVTVSSNTVKESQMMKNLDSNSYTLNLTDNTELITDGDVSITEIK